MYNYFLCVYISYCRPHFPEHVTAVDQEKPKFIDLEGIGMLLDTLVKTICEHTVHVHILFMGNENTHKSEGVQHPGARVDM